MGSLEGAVFGYRSREAVAVPEAVAVAAAGEAADAAADAAAADDTLTCYPDYCLMASVSASCHP